MTGATQIELTFVARLDQWGASAAPQVLLSKWKQSTPRAVVSLQIGPSGALGLYLGTTGGTFDIVFNCPLPLPLAPGQLGGIHCDVNLQNAGSKTCQFYYSPDGVTWFALGAAHVIAGVAPPPPGGYAAPGLRPARRHPLSGR